MPNIAILCTQLTLLNSDKVIAVLNFVCTA